MIGSGYFGKKDHRNIRRWDGLSDGGLIDVIIVEPVQQLDCLEVVRVE